jgi:hypothetical protein
LTIALPGLTLQRMRIILALAFVLGLCACVHAPETSQRPRCPDSEMASQCSSGGLKCEVDEKRACDLCRCERMVF